ncbi:MAG: quinolinate synthase NadA [Flavobacteriales bacterium]|nr:quinolinate synthase NadA [Flavobacteriales bacterium]
MSQNISDQTNYWIEEINRLRVEKDAVILAHYYQQPDIQEVADFVGDSLDLSKKAASTTASIIVFAGVHFMAETAKILNPSKKVLLPDLAAGCSLAESCSAEDLKKFKIENPNHIVVSYVNTSAEVKALSDLVCTSSNAEAIIRSIPATKPILFAPDKNLGRYIMEITGRKMDLWEGSCIVHESFSLDKLISLHKEHPTAQIIAHPESEGFILDVANFIGSTSQLIEHVKTQECTSFIVATEAGILHKMQQVVPHKKLIPAPAKENNTCACSECGFMKMNSIEKLYLCLKNETPEITLDQHLINEALIPIQRMLALS